MLDERPLSYLQLSERRRRPRIGQCVECFLAGALGALVVLAALGFVL